MLDDEERPPPAHLDFTSHFTSDFYDADDLRHGDTPPFGSEEDWDGVYEWAGRLDELRAQPSLRSMLAGSPEDLRAEDPELDGQRIDDIVVNQGFALLRHLGHIDLEGVDG